MVTELLGHYHHYEVQKFQEMTHGWYKEPVYAGWESTKNFVDTGGKRGSLVRGLLGRLSRGTSLLSGAETTKKTCQAPIKMSGRRKLGGGLSMA